MQFGIPGKVGGFPAESLNKWRPNLTLGINANSQVRTNLSAGTISKSAGLLSTSVDRAVLLSELNNNQALRSMRDPSVSAGLVLTDLQCSIRYARTFGIPEFSLAGCTASGLWARR